MDEGSHGQLQAHIHRAAAALLDLQVHLLQSRAATSPGGVEEYNLDSMLEAVTNLRAALGDFIEASIPAHGAAEPS